MKDPKLEKTTGTCQDKSVQWTLKSLGIGLYLGEIASEEVKGTGWSAIVPVMTSDTKVNVMASDTKGS